ncbi:uncharacterized protein I303_107559 [Kwoniella dejecticola CBS 10117]|uniref:BAH domain-containing protein n=1 Tax=Kwoniella dejecticola CBS 10117 TaxID=1296121 RepID=A0A1A5ZV28_9TREE|nr:uncharacterized protein I303_07569 [Kwoniella dejecticola CBS 10117]OBR81659.1 hypothetical protein I303_07569 [Kwoniella dejecticola CBS 10117]
MSARKRKNHTSSSDHGQSDIPSALAWVPPTDEEFRGLKRYKSFLLPPNNSYAAGQFVWLAHEAPKPTASRANPTSAQPPAKKARTSMIGLDGLPSPEPTPPGPLERIHNEGDSDPHWDAGLWIGKIIEIRAKDTSYVWMRIRWMCRSLGELKESGVRTGLPRSKTGIKEVYMLGAEHDMLQPVGAVEGMAPVVVFDERNPLQAPFGSKKIYLQCEARTPTEEEAQLLHSKRISGNVDPRMKKKGGRASEPGPSGHLFPLRQPTCYCDEPYRLVSEREDPMALCSHKDCLKWFHFGCLDWKKNHRRDATPSAIENIITSGVELMKLLPDYGLTTPAEQLPLDKDPGTLFVSPIEDVIKGNHDQNQRKVSSTANGASDADDVHGKVPQLSQDQLDRYKAVDRNLPASVLRNAQLAVVRGTLDTGIVGNARMILRARQIVMENRKVRNNPKIDALQVAVVNQMVEEWKKVWEVEDGIESPKEEEEEKASKDKVKVKGKVHDDEEGEARAQLKARPVIWLCPSCRRAI